MAVARSLSEQYTDSNIAQEGGATLASRVATYAGTVVRAVGNGIAYQDGAGLEFTIPAFTGEQSDYETWLTTIQTEEGLIFDNWATLFGEGGS